MENVQSRSEWMTPELRELGSVEDLTQIKFQGGFDGIEIQLDNGTIVSGS